MNTPVTSHESVPTSAGIKTRWASLQGDFPLFSGNPSEATWEKAYDLLGLDAKSMEAFITRYTCDIEAHNAQITSEIQAQESRKREAVAKLNYLPKLDKAARSEATSAIARLKEERRSTKSENRKTEIDEEVEENERILEEYRQHSDLKTSITEEIERIGKRIAALEKSIISTGLQAELDRLRARLQCLTIPASSGNGEKKKTESMRRTPSFWSSTPGRVAGILLGLSLVGGATMIALQKKDEKMVNKQAQDPNRDHQNEQAIYKSFSDRINTAFFDFIRDPSHARVDICGPFLSKTIAELGKEFRLGNHTIKNAHFEGGISKNVRTALLYRMDYIYTLVKPDGTSEKKEATHEVDISKQIPEPNWVEPNMMQNNISREKFERMFFDQCQIRFPENNIYDIYVLGVKVLEQIEGEDGACVLKIQLYTNEWLLVIERHTQLLDMASLWLKKG